MASTNNTDINDSNDSELTSFELAELEELLDLQLYEAAEESYYSFFKQAWSRIDPSPFKDNWHIGCLCDHLQALAEGELRRLIITVPPRSGKSRIASVCFPAWVWIHEPQAKFITISHSQSLSSTFSRDARTLMQSEWYANRWIGEDKSFQFKSDSNTIMRIDNNIGGYRLAATPRQNILGHGFTYCIADDILDGRQANNTNEKHYTNEIFFDGVLRNRSNDPDNDKIIIVQQRLAEDDLPGHVMGKEPKLWFLLNLPAEYDGPKFKSPIGCDDIRTEIGELLIPDRLSADFLASQKNVNLLKYKTLYQQDPQPDEGNILKAEWLQEFHTPIHVDAMDALLMSCDLTFGDTGESYNVIQLWGTTNKNYYLLDEQRGKWDFLQQQAAIEILHSKYKDKGLQRIIIEEKANGSAIISSLKKKIPIIEGFDPKQFKLNSNSKIERLQSVLRIFLESRVIFPSTKLVQRYPWLMECRKELLTFPLAKNDDRVDALTQALYYLDTVGLVSMNKALTREATNLGGRHNRDKDLINNNNNNKAIRSIWNPESNSSSSTSAIHNNRNYYRNIWR